MQYCDLLNKKYVNTNKIDYITQYLCATVDTLPFKCLESVKIFLTLMLTSAAFIW